MKFIRKEDDIKSEELVDLLFELSPDSELKERPITFPSEKDAIEYLNDMSKDNTTYCVKYLAPLGKFEESQSFIDFNDRLKFVNEDILNYPKSLIKRLSEQKSNLKGCSNQDCKSSINKDYHSKNMFKLLEDKIIENEDLDFNDKLKNNMEALNCPICNSNEFIMTETDHEQFKRFENKKNDIKRKLNEEKIKFEVKSGTKTVTILGIKSLEDEEINNSDVVNEDNDINETTVNDEIINDINEITVNDDKEKVINNDYEDNIIKETIIHHVKEQELDTKKELF